MSLTTRAMKALKRLQKRKIYNQTVIKVRLPKEQGVILTVHCHALDTPHTVAKLLMEQAFRMDVSDVKNATNTSTNTCTYTYPFQLHTTMSSHLNMNLNENDTNESLLDLHLVPAATVHLTWNDSGRSAIQKAPKAQKVQELTEEDSDNERTHSFYYRHYSYLHKERIEEIIALLTCSQSSQSSQIASQISSQVEGGIHTSESSLMSQMKKKKKQQSNKLKQRAIPKWLKIGRRK